MAITQKLREIGGIINSTDLNYNFKRIQEDLRLAVEGVLFSEKYSQLETIADRNAIPEADLKPGLWVAVSENGFVYEYNTKDDVTILPEKREFGINLKDLPDIPFRIDEDQTSGTAFDICYVCKADSRDANWKYTSETTGVTYNDGDWAVYKRVTATEGEWIKIPKWTPIMNVTSILENNLIGKLEDLHTEDKYRIVNAINEIHDDLGTIAELETTDKTTAVAAINELDARAGELVDLKTAAKANLVSAINEVDDNVGPIENLTTTNKGNTTLAINELHAEHGTLSNLHTEKKDTFVNSINEIHDDLGTISTLTTDNKSTAVAAINELDERVGELNELTTSTNKDIVAAVNTIGNINTLTTDVKTTAVHAINELDTRSGELKDLTTASKTNLVSAINELDKDLGAPASLTTKAKNNVVSAVNELDKEVGDLSGLTTAHKSNLVGAISEIDGDVGDISTLTTTVKTNTVSAINELDTRAGELKDLTTSSKTNLVSAINELDKDLGAPASLTTTAKNNVVSAVNELDKEIGTISSLTTTNKNTLVAAISEVDGDVGNISLLTTTAKADTVAAINELKAITDTLRGSTIIIGKIPLNTKDVTDEALTAKAKEIMGTTTVQTGWTLVDNEKHEWHWNGSNWQDMEQPNIYPAQNDTLGTVRGSTAGDVSITDGNLTVNHAANATKLNNQTASYYARSAHLGTVANLTTTAKVAVNAINELDAEIGTVSGLKTEHKTTLVGAANEIHDDLGTISSLTTTTKTNAVAAINELDTRAGELNSLKTSAKTNLVDAINEVDTNIGPVENLTTTNKTNATVAINELHSEHGTLSSLKTEKKDTFVNAINEIHDDLGTVGSLTTTNKSNAVVAINELKGRLDTADTNITNLQNNKADKTNVLQLNNTTPFDPTSDYHPATKKYVDSLTGGASWGEIINNIEDQEDLMNLLAQYAKTSDVITKTNTTAFTPTANYHPATKAYVDNKTKELNTWGKISGDIANQQDLQNELIAKQDKATAWNTTNLIVSTEQPDVPAEGYVIWIDLNS